LDKFSNDTGVPGLNREEAHNKRIPISERIEQKTIASYLDRKTAQIDAQITREKKSIELLKEYRTALISEVVTGKVDVREVSV
ncbi:MAG: restriction endonuclease subunit S, partial [Armatimonadetes bacterium]|nr:restriction endonuclease subunit S [Armatimonadota bacterium]